MRTKKQTEMYGQYILDNFSEEYAVPGMDYKQAIKIALKTYDEQGMNHEFNMRKLPNDADRLADWMQGLPSPFYPEYVNYEIEQLLKGWGVIKDTDNKKRVEKLVEGWWKYWAVFMLTNSK